MELKLYKFGFILVFLFSLFFASWYVIHSDIIFSSDVARDFHLLRELDQKKIMLIGPRASGNLFHGPGWPYMNYPFYVLGHGNPVVVGWGWVVFTALFGLSCLYVGSRLFDKKTGYLFGAFGTLYMAFHAKGMINPHGAMLFIPFFFYTFIRYFQTLKTKYLILHLLLAAFMIQIELAIGIPLAILSFAAILYKQIKTKNLKQTLMFLLLPFLFLNFVVFDLKHDFLLFHTAMKFITPKAGSGGFDYVGAFANRLYLMLFGVEILRRDLFRLNFVLLAGTLIFAFTQLKSKKFGLIYGGLLYFYLGYFLLSFIDKGPLLYFYQFPIFIFVFLIFSSGLTYKNLRIAFITIFTLVLLLNIRSAYLDMSDSRQFIGKDVWSWKFQNKLASFVFKVPEKEFGYFVYSPDALAYEPKYAMLYNALGSSKTAGYFKKENTTYIIAAPPPRNNPYMQSDWWIKNQIKVDASPSSSIVFENGYEIKKYTLSEDQTKIPFDESVDPGLNFR